MNPSDPTPGTPLSAPATDSELRAWLEESLPQARMAAIEEQLRNSVELRRRVSRLLATADQGAHSLGAIWRRHRISCPTREQWGMSLLGVLPAEWQEYLDFHLQTAGCRYCEATLEDLRSADQPSEPVTRRRKRYFDSSAGRLNSQQERRT